MAGTQSGRPFDYYGDLIGRYNPALPGRSVGRPVGTGTSLNNPGLQLPGIALNQPNEQNPTLTIQPMQPPQAIGGSAPLNPALDGLKHSAQADPAVVQPTLPPPGTPGPYANVEQWLSGLSKPFDAPVGLADPERQRMYNLGRGQIQGATSALMDETRQAMGGRGFTAGESGVADRRLAGIAQEGQRQLGQYSTGLANEEALRRFDQTQAVNALNLQRLGTGGQLGLGLDQLLESIRGRQASEGAAAGAQNLAQERFGFDKERWQKEFGYQQQMDALRMLFGLGGGAQAGQTEEWSPYWTGLLGQYGG